MDRHYVVQTIRQVGGEFGRVMACLQGEEYVAGYEQAVKDMVRMFEYGSAVVERPKTQRMVLFGGTKGRRHEGS